MRNCVCVLLGMFVVLDAISSVPKHSAMYYAAMSPEVQEAQRKGAKAKLVYRILDDEGNPMADQQIDYCWQNDYPRKRWCGNKRTDSNGEVVLEDTVGGELSVSVRRCGYYRSWDSVKFHWRKGVNPLVEDGRWQPYGERRVLVLKRKKNPVNIPSLSYTPIAAPTTNTWIGFDMESFQWTQPYGNGKNNDILMRFNYERRDRYAVNWATLDISFTNNPCAGFYVLPKDGFSEMKSPYHAETNAIYVTERTFRREFFNKYINAIAADDCMIFRTRTKVDDRGNLVSAHYGKIYGLWEFATLIRINDAFFNPSPNDTNLEDMRTFRESEERCARQ